MAPTAQDLYDYREETALISGTDLHTLFSAVLGDPSPAGRTRIDPAALERYAVAQEQAYTAHRASGGTGGTYLLDNAKFARHFVR